MGIFRIPQTALRYFVLAVKTFLSGLLVLMFVQYIATHYEKIIFDHKIERLNVLIPGSFAHLIDIVRNKAPVNPRQLQEDIRFYEKLVEYFPDHSDAWGMLGFCYYHLGNTASALNSYEKAISYSPENFWFHYNAGVILFEKGQYFEATRFLQKAIAVNAKKTVDFLSIRRPIYELILKEDPEFAKEMIIRLARGYRDSYRMLVVSCSQLRNYKSLVGYASKAIELNVGSKEDFYYYIGFAYFQSKRYKEASVYLEEALKITPNFMEAAQYLTMCYQVTGQEQKAVELKETSPTLIKYMKGSTVLNGRYIKLQMF